MAFWVYVLRCADGKYYTGHTDHLDRRLAQHQHGGVCDFTSRRRPVELAWADWLPSRLEALEAERRVKDWSRAKKEALFRSDWRAVSWFARPPGERGPFPSPSKQGTGDPFASSEVEKRLDQRVSTSLDTNGLIMGLGEKVI